MLDIFVGNANPALIKPIMNIIKIPNLLDISNEIYLKIIQKNKKNIQLENNCDNHKTRKNIECTET
jgi:hypothetical protein